MDKIRVLIADDNEAMRLIERKMIEKVEGFDLVGEAKDGLECIQMVESLRPQIVFLDVEMPGKTGVEAARVIQDMDPSIILIFATAHDQYMGDAFEVYAFDYLVKPFAFEELLARIRVLIRKNSVSNSNIITVADLTVDISSRKVTRGGKDILLSAKEYELLQYLAVNNGIVLSREKIEDHIWNYDYEGGTNVVDVYIRYLRKKIDEGYDKKLIHTVRGMGYVLREEK